MGWAKKAKGGQAQGPLVKSVHIPLLSEGTQANPSLLRRKKGALMTKNLAFQMGAVLKVTAFVFSPRKTSAESDPL